MICERPRSSMDRALGFGPRGCGFNSCRGQKMYQCGYGKSPSPFIAPPHVSGDTTPRGRRRFWDIAQALVSHAPFSSTALCLCKFRFTRSVRAGVIETPFRPWQGRVLPLNHARLLFFGEDRVVPQSFHILPEVRITFKTPWCAPQLSSQFIFSSFWLPAVVSFLLVTPCSLEN